MWIFNIEGSINITDLSQRPSLFNLALASLAVALVATGGRLGSLGPVRSAAADKLECESVR